MTGWRGDRTRAGQKFPFAQRAVAAYAVSALCAGDELSPRAAQGIVSYTTAALYYLGC